MKSLSGFVSVIRDLYASNSHMLGVLAVALILYTVSAKAGVYASGETYKAKTTARLTCGPVIALEIQDRTTIEAE